MVPETPPKNFIQGGILRNVLRVYHGLELTKSGVLGSEN